METCSTNNPGVSEHVDIVFIDGELNEVGKDIVDIVKENLDELETEWVGIPLPAEAQLEAQENNMHVDLQLLVPTHGPCLRQTMLSHFAIPSRKEDQQLLEATACARGAKDKNNGTQPQDIQDVFKYNFG